MSVQVGVHYAHISSLAGLSCRPVDALPVGVEAIPPPREVTSSLAAGLIAALDDAVVFGEREAMSLGHFGVLVTRHEYNRFTVEVSPDVPFGLTLECDQMDRSPGSKDDR